MSDTLMDSHRHRGVLLQTVIYWTFIGLCCAGHRPVSREERLRFTRHHDRLAQRLLHSSFHDQGAQRIEYPLVNDQDTQGIRYPSLHNSGQTVQYPSLHDSSASSQIQKCAPGYYRDGSGPYLGRCVPCDCNGLADECEDRTGRCLNCKFNTAGDRCEGCKEGYYGNAAQKTCRVCPCPFSVSTNSFAVGCSDVYGEIQCVCRAGYSGDRCESCSPGYYGDPQQPGGSCRPCKCNGNGNICDPRTGVCKNTLEPGDINTDEHCQECDNCAQTLLHDLEKLDNELTNIKAQLENASASVTSQDGMSKLEKAVSDTKILLHKFSLAINNENSRVRQLEEDTASLADDISSLKFKARKRATEAEIVEADVEKTHKRAKDLNNEIDKMLKKIQDLLDQLKNSEGRGDSLPNDSLAKMLEEAQRMVSEMENRNFTPQKTAAEKEKDEAKKLLDYIKANVSKQCDENEAAAEKIRSLLKDYNTKLNDLDKALKESRDLVNKANAQNGLNAQTLRDLQKRIEDLKKERKTVEDKMAVAKNELQKTDDLVKSLSDSKMEYEQLAAQLDGAKTDLTTKLNEITKATAKKDIVEAAEEHAKLLNKLAQELEEDVKNASGLSEVRDAKHAIEAYKNITDAINAAEAAANEAKDAADTVLDNITKQKLPQRATELKETGEDLLNNAKEAEKNLTDTAIKLNDLKERLSKANEKKEALEKDLLEAQSQLNDTKRDDIADMIEGAKRKAALANDTASNTMDRLNAIREEIAKIDVPGGGSNLSNVLDDVDHSVKNLLKTIPSLNDKISEMENLTSQYSPINNVSESIKNIKELIEKARDAANRIVIPMNFGGDAHVEIRPPKNLDDLKAYTALSLSLQRPEDGRGDGRRRRRQTENEDMFVLYLGSRNSSKNYIGMCLRNNVLYGVYKLNGQEYEIQSGYITKSVSEPAKFDRVDLYRIYQDAEMILTKDIASSKPDDPINSYSKGMEIKDLLDVSPSDVVFYVGGYPANFTPPISLRYPNYKGCIEFVSFNDKVVSLYNFLRAEKINLEVPCKRYVPPMDSYFYDGTGYAKVVLDRVPNTLQITVSIIARSENGLLFYASVENNYLIVTVEKGYIFIRSNLVETSVGQVVKVIPVNDWTKMNIVLINSQKVIVQFASPLPVIANIPFESIKLTEFYIGGAPEQLRERHNITIQPFKGCLKNLQVNQNFKSFDEQVGVSKGCTGDSLVSRRAQFSFGSSLANNLTGFNLDQDISVSLGFKSTENQGIIMQDKQLTNEIKLTLENGHVILRFNDKLWKSNKKYHDGQWHYLTVTKTSERTELRVDDDDNGQEQSTSRSVPETGGSMFLGSEMFKGCISNIYTRRPDNLYKPEDLSLFKASGDVLMDVCSVDSPVQLMLDRNSERDAVIQVINESASTCVLPSLVQHSYQMGGPVSSLSYSLPLQVLQPRPYFSLDVRTRSMEGLLFYAATRGGRAHLALYMSKGRIRLSVGKDREILNREKYNDGRWHTVIFSLEKKKFRLVVDGIRAQDGQLTNAELRSMQHFISPVYLGSAPESLHKELKSKVLPKKSVYGCVRNFKMNGELMSNSTTNRGAGPCFEGQAQKGVYFSGNGAHVIINESFVLGSTFELLCNIRPRSQTGLLLYVGASSRAHYEPSTGHFLTVYMLRGEVVAKVNNGKGEFMVSVKPKTSLCDGTFHKISVIKRKNVVQLSVDTTDNYKIGPPSSTTTLTKDPLYVGGIPELLMQQMLPITPSFVGCIQDMKINDISVSFNRLSGVFGPVNLNECPG